MTDIDAVAEAIWREQSFGYASAGPPHLRMAQAAIDALQLTEETRSRELYSGGTGLKYTEFRQVRLVSPWRRAAE